MRTVVGRILIPQADLDGTIQKRMVKLYLKPSRTLFANVDILEPYLVLFL